MKKAGSVLRENVMIEGDVCIIGTANGKNVGIQLMMYIFIVISKCVNTFPVLPHEFML
jgi:hypothetical protein